MITARTRSWAAAAIAVAAAITTTACSSSSQLPPPAATIGSASLYTATATTAASSGTTTTAPPSTTGTPVSGTSTPRAPSTAPPRPSALTPAPPTSSTTPATATTPAPNPATSATVAKAPAAPRLTADPADYSSAEKVAAAHLAAWCFQPIDQPVNTNIATAAQWVTAAGLESDKATALDNTRWADTVAAGLTSVCGPVNAVISEGAPSSEKTRWIISTAPRAWVDKTGKVRGQQLLAQTHRVLLAPDGRWLVDIAVAAG